MISVAQGRLGDGLAIRGYVRQPDASPFLHPPGAAGNCVCMIPASSQWPIAPAFHEPEISMAFAEFLIYGLPQLLHNLRIPFALYPWLVKARLDVRLGHYLILLTASGGSVVVQQAYRLIDAGSTNELPQSCVAAVVLGDDPVAVAGGNGAGVDSCLRSGRGLAVHGNDIEGTSASPCRKRAYRCPAAGNKQPGIIRNSLDGQSGCLYDCYATIGWRMISSRW